MDGVSHTVEVTAATLYEAVAQGLAAIRGSEWVAGIAQGLNAVKVSVADVRVEHEVKLMDFTKWLEKPGGSPREMSDRHRIRSILGMPVHANVTSLRHQRKPTSRKGAFPDGPLHREWPTYNFIGNYHIEILFAHNA
jgi:hypothetical protein